MPSPQGLQPVLKMKVDELFLNWLSEGSVQEMLKDYLRKIKNGDELEFGTNNSNYTENNNIASNFTVNEKTSASLSASCSPPSATLPSGSGSSNRAGPNSRAPRRSISIKKAQLKKEEAVSPALSQSIPKFYFPRGRPKANINIDSLISKIEKTFSQFPNERVTIEDMGKVAKACECPLYWKAPLFFASGGDRRGYVSVHKFVAMWRKVLQTCHDDASKFLYLLAKPGCPYLEQEDFIPFLQDVVDSHTGLAFLKEASDFHSRYITTNVALLEEEEDVNQLTEYFSYEHFYVIYCKFWELDTDHDLYIDQRDMTRHNDQAISHKMIERIFSGTVTRDRKIRKEGRLSYADFVWFLISEEDKKTETSIEYWFRCMDVDGDGILSMYELQYFYQEQCQRLEAMAIEPLPFEDCLCQMLDLVRPETPGKITLRDLKKCKLAHIFFDTFFNIEKYLDHEQRDPFMMAKDAESLGQEISDWERYAAEEYDILVAEEAANEQYNDGYENPLLPIDCISSEFELCTEKRNLFDLADSHCNLELDDYKYADDF
ncbi:Serine/threonine-protein phosphatase 2A regulatory subunit B'' subunit beta [Bagarius yarrelli]|uniref:Serine/threonine-protein phosphatase 2A regulatory subunit B'' subunit beta n=1 Tax=Bagarius yarrelli TaxID=175774 RepID=A0A556TXQ7_BAGYA|nr:Serine/threonine-protein phosphatase 2A regulatory subunit B'' subunit beta [Bagarius yarrelli]